MQQLSYYYPTDRSYLQQLHLNSIEFISIPNRPKISISALSLSLYEHLIALIYYHISSYPFYLLDISISF